MELDRQTSIFIDHNKSQVSATYIGTELCNIPIVFSRQADLYLPIRVIIFPLGVIEHDRSIVIGTGYGLNLEAVASTYGLIVKTCSSVIS